MKTQENLLKAIAGESLARNKYSFFAIRARGDGFESIARIFEETADNEMEHAERLLEFVNDKVKTNTEIYIDPIKSTKENVKIAAEGENYEAEKMYPEFEKVAIDENQPQIAEVFKEISEVEEKHRDRYLGILKNLEDGTVFSRNKDIEWKCLNCGYVHKGKEAPQKCPACAKPQAWYEPRGFNW
jgi:rubrerythrin